MTKPGENSAAQRSKNKTAKPTILLVDGDTETHAGAVESLTAAGFDVSVASDPGKAFAIMEVKFTWSKPSLVIVDLILPQMSGFEFVRRFVDRFEQHKIPIFMMSKYPSAEDRLEIHSAGAHALLSKPLSGQAVNHELEQMRIKKLKSEIGVMAFTEK